MDDKVKPWGYHLSINAGGCAVDKITDGEHIKAFSKALVEAIDMKAYGDPIAVHFAAHDPSKGGYTLVQLIETSNICAHFVDATGEMYLDVFSCKEFDIQTVVDVCTEWFGVQSGNIFYMERSVDSVSA